MRLQFRVWDKEKQEMLYNNFIVRDGNPPSQEFYDKQNSLHPDSKIVRPEISHAHAEPLEHPDLKQDSEINKIMGDEFASYSLIDWSNFYFQNYVTMQCTGFHDKNNQLIWEGDLLKFGNLVHVVQWYYSSFIWNGQMIADFRDYDEYGNEIINNNCCSDSVALALGYQGDVYGLQTCNVEKVGTIFENGKEHGYTQEAIDSFIPSYPNNY